jgi:4-hydroxy-4-methyl-2-oxoglutarate aldolase
MVKELSVDTFQELARCDSPTIADAIEPFGVRLRNEGFSDPDLRCFLSHLPPMLGYAVTFRVRSAEPPMIRNRYADRIQWYQHLQGSPVPRVIVIEDVDHKPGCGALVGSVDVLIMKAFDCVGVVTNGAVRSLSEFERLNVHVFARNLSVSHAYGHVVEFGKAVQIVGLSIQPGDLIHGDQHGIVTIPRELADLLPGAADRIRARDQMIERCCAAADFSLEKLRTIIRQSTEIL